jgi:5-methyltetrahydrofolate--homocysteine methyltransferase
MEDLFDQGYRGSRYPSATRPAPTSRSRPAVRALKPERSASSSEEFQLHPEQSTSAIIASSEAKYFNAR